MRDSPPMHLITGMMIMRTKMTMVMSMTTMVFMMITLTARVTITTKKTASTRMRRTQVVRKRRMRRAARTNFQMTTFGTGTYNTNSTLSILTWPPPTNRLHRLLPLNQPQAPPQTQKSQMRTRKAARTRPISMACMVNPGDIGKDKVRVIKAVKVVKRHIGTQLAKRNKSNSQSKPISPPMSIANAVVTVVEAVSLTQCLSIPRLSTNCLLISLLKPQELASSANIAKYPNNNHSHWSSNSSHSTTDTVHRLQLAVTVAARLAGMQQLSRSSSSSSQPSIKVADSESENSRGTPLLTRRLSPSKMTIPARSSSRRMMKDAKSLFLSGVAMVKRKSARIAKNAKRSGSLSAHRALSLLSATCVHQCALMV